MWFSLIASTVGGFLLMKWADKKFLNGYLSFIIPFWIFYGHVVLVSLLSIPHHLIREPMDCNNGKRSARFIAPISRLLGITWEVRGRQYLGAPEGCVMVKNHQSSLDILGMFSFWDFIPRMAPVAKKELLYLWPFGLAAYLSGVIFIDRKNPVNAKKQMDEAARSIHKDGTKILVYPEGTRNTRRELLKFKKGAFHIAITCQAPVMPVVVSPYFFINPHKRFFDSGKVIVEALPPVPTEGLTLADMDVLMDKVWHLMNEHYRKLAQELRASLPQDYPGL